MKLLEDFLPYFAAEVPGAGEPLMLRATLDACIEFCDLSHHVQMTLDPIDLEVGVSEYEAFLPSALALVRVTDAWLAGLPARVKNAGEFGNPAALTLTATAAGQPKTVTFTGGARLIVDPVPETAYPGGLVLHAAVKPKRSAASVPDVLLDDFADVIAAGACARLMAMGGNQPFANPALAGAKRTMFVAGANRAMVKTATGGQGHRPSRVKLRRI